MRHQRRVYSQQNSQKLSEEKNKITHSLTVLEDSFRTYFSRLISNPFTVLKAQSTKNSWAVHLAQIQRGRLSANENDTWSWTENRFGCFLVFFFCTRIFKIWSYREILKNFRWKIKYALAGTCLFEKT